VTSFSTSSQKMQVCTHIQVVQCVQYDQSGFCILLGALGDETGIKTGGVLIPMQWICKKQKYYWCQNCTKGNNHGWTSLLTMIMMAA